MGTVWPIQQLLTWVVLGPPGLHKGPFPTRPVSSEGGRVADRPPHGRRHRPSPQPVLLCPSVHHSVPRARLRPGGPWPSGNNRTVNVSHLGPQHAAPCRCPIGSFGELSGLHCPFGLFQQAAGLVSPGDRRGNSGTEGESLTHSGGEGGAEHCRSAGPHPELSLSRQLCRRHGVTVILSLPASALSEGEHGMTSGGGAWGTASGDNAGATAMMMHKRPLSPRHTPRALSVVAM